MKRLFLLATTALLLTISPAAAQKSERIIGSWFVTKEEDPFDGKAKVIAVSTTYAGNFAMAVRCLENGVSVALFDTRKSLTEGEAFQIKFRGDRAHVITTFGTALDTGMIEITEADEIVLHMSIADQAAFRFENKRGVTNTAVFKMRSSKPVLGEVLQACRSRK